MPAPLARPLLLTSRLVLAASEPALIAPVLDFQRRNATHFAPWDPPAPRGFYTQDFQRDRLQQAAEAFVDGTGYRYWMMLRNEPGRVVGTAHVSQVSRGAFQSAMLGYALDAPLQGQGLMHEALQALIDEMFGGTVNLHRLQANHRPENHRSAAVLARLGFRTEGVCPDYLYIDGRWRDHVTTALINPAFRLPAGW